MLKGSGSTEPSAAISFSARTAASPTSPRAFGQTETALLRVRVGDALVSVEVYVAINAETHPALAERLRAAPPHLPALDVAGHWTELVLPLWYYEPRAALCVLILPPSLRYRELDERAGALGRLASLPRAELVERWMLTPEVITSPGELDALRARHGTSPPSLPAGALAAEKLSGWQRSLDEQARALARRSRTTPPSGWPVRKDPGATESVDEERATAEGAAFDEPLSDPSLLGVVELEAAEEPPVPATSSRADDGAGPPSAPPRPAPATRDTIDDALAAAAPAVREAMIAEESPAVTERREIAAAGHDPWLIEAMALGRHSIAVERDAGAAKVRVALAAALLPDARALLGELDVRVVLHRAPTYPVITLLIAPPAALRGDRRSIAVLCLDIMIDRDRATLAALARSFELLVDVFANGRRSRRVLLRAPLAENVSYLIRAAKEHLQRLGERGLSVSGIRAIEHVLHPDHDLLGWHHPYADELRAPDAGATAESTRAALALVRRFTEPAGEDYLFCTRGLPMPAWRASRRAVLERALAFGLWPGPELAKVAVSDGLARSRRQLVAQLLETFEARLAAAEPLGLDDDVVEDNRAHLTREADALGVGAVRAPIIRSDSDAVVAGSIDLSSKDVPKPIERCSIEELLAQLSDSTTRVVSILELCRRRAKEAAPGIIAALPLVPRDRLARVLAAIVTLDEAAQAPLVAACANPKRQLRQGAALALIALRREDATIAVVDLLFIEPTEIWREVARAMGHLGALALTPLALALGRHGVTPRAEERVAWALAYLGANDSRRALVQISNGHSIMAPIAAKALALIEPAARDVAAREAGEEQANEIRELSRQFFVELAGTQARVPSNSQANP